MNFVSNSRARWFRPRSSRRPPRRLPQTSGELKAVEASLAATQSMTANFLQTDGKGRQMAGTLSLKRPGKIRFAYGGGVNMLLVADGQRLNFIDYDVGQKSSWPIAKSPLAVLLAQPGSRPDRADRAERTQECHRRPGPRRPPAGVRNIGAGVCPRRRRSGRPEAGRLDRDRRPEQENHGPPIEPALQCRVPDSAFTFAEPKRKKA